MRPDNATRWYENIESVAWRTPPPLEVGTRLEFVARFLGRRLAYTYEVREHVAGERFVMSTEQGPFPMETTYGFEDASGGHADDAAQSRRAGRLREGRRPADGARDAPREPSGPAPDQGDPRGRRALADDFSPPPGLKLRRAGWAPW